MGDINTCFSQIRKPNTLALPWVQNVSWGEPNRVLSEGSEQLRATPEGSSMASQVSEKDTDDVVGDVSPTPQPTEDNVAKCRECLADRDACATWTYMTCQGSPGPVLIVFCVDVFVKDMFLSAVYVAAAIAARSDPVAEMITEPCLYSIAYVIDVLRWFVVTLIAFYTTIVVIADITQCVESIKHDCGYIAEGMALWFWIGVSSSCALGLICFADFMLLLCLRPAVICSPEHWQGRRGEERRARMLYTLCCVLVICFSYWVSYIWTKATTCPY